MGDTRIVRFRVFDWFESGRQKYRRQIAFDLRCAANVRVEVSNEFAIVPLSGEGLVLALRIYEVTNCSDGAILVAATPDGGSLVDLHGQLTSHPDVSNLRVVESPPGMHL